MWGYAFLIVGLAYIFGLFIDLTGDSGLYATISRQMVESGDWFNLKINGEPYDQKPHLFFWLAGLGIQLFGNTNFAFKLFPFLYGLLGIYFTYRLGKQLFSNETGKLAALITGTSQLFFLYFFDFHTDTVLQTGVVLALWQLAAYLQKKKIINFVSGFLGIGLAMFSKGPIGAILPFFAVLLYLLGRKDFRQLFHPKWILGVLIVLIVISPTLFHLYKSFGFEGLKFYFITNNIGRITGEYAGSSSDPFFYIHTLLWAVLPWTVFVVGAIVFEIKSWFAKDRKNDWGVYLLGSVLILVVIFSVAKGKAPNYFLIVLSPISVIAARWINRVSEMSVKKQRKLVLLQNIFIFLLVLFFIFIAVVFGEGKFGLSILLLVLLLSATFYFIKTQNSPIHKTIFVTVVVIGTLNLFLNAKVLPDLYKYQGARQVLAEFENDRKEKDILINLHVEEYEIFYYAKSPIIQFSNWDEYYDLFRKEGTWIYTNKGGYEGILDLNVNLDSVHTINCLGMNQLSYQFLNSTTRKNSLHKNYLIKIH